MLPRSSRLPGSEFHSGRYRTKRTPYFFLKVRPNGRASSRIGVVVGRAVHKNAANRNFWKRQAKAALAGVKNGASDWLIIPSAKVTGLTRREFREKVSEAAADLAGRTT